MYGHSNTHGHIYTGTQMYINTNIQLETHRHIDAHAHKHLYKWHTHIRKATHRDTHGHIYMSTHTARHGHTDTHGHIYRHTDTHGHTNIHRHTYADRHRHGYPWTPRTHTQGHTHENTLLSCSNYWTGLCGLCPGDWAMGSLAEITIFQLTVPQLLDLKRPKRKRIR